MSFLIRLLLPFLVALSIFSLDFFHFRVDKTLPSEQVADEAVAAPPDNVLDGVASISLGVSLGIPPQNWADAASEIYQGRLSAPSFSSQTVALRGYPGDLFVVGPTFQLVMASLSVEDMLLREFERSGRREYYELAKDRILEFANWEARRRKPTAFLWNDHAVAARISVLTRLWRHMRVDPAANGEERIALLGLVARSGSLLAKSSQFTVKTNHGLMQNIALLQICAVFPGLRQSDKWKRLAIERLEVQLGFYISSEGVVLEHSAEYHLLGVQLLGYAIQLARLNGMVPPDRLVSAYQRSQTFSNVLVRPDGSLPLIGDTAGKAFSREDHNRFLRQVNRSRPSESGDGAPAPDARVYPVSGYAVWNDRGEVPSQVTVVWAKHDRHGHKHADETSVHFWSRGLDWITATGYWPYGENGYDEASGWRGSNAPHLRGEAAHSNRRVELKAHGEGPHVQAIDIENTRESGAVFRRQVVKLGAERVLVVDAVDSARQPVDTIWTLRPETTLQAEGMAHFVARPPTGDRALHLSFAFAGEGEGVAKASAGGSFSPFTGWVVLGRRPTAAPAVEVERGAGSHITAALLSVEDLGTLPPSLSLEPGGTAEEWHATVQMAQGSLHVSRRGASLAISGPLDDVLEREAARTQVLDLIPPSPQSEQLLALKAAMTEALERYPAWRDLKDFHNRLYALIAGLWAGVELALRLPPARRCRENFYRHAGNSATSVVALHGLYVLGWCALASWIHIFYLETSAHLLSLLLGR